MKCACVKLPEYGKKSKNWKGPEYQWYWRCMYCGKKTKSTRLDVGLPTGR